MQREVSPCSIYEEVYENIMTLIAESWDGVGFENHANGQSFPRLPIE